MIKFNIDKIKKTPLAELPAFTSLCIEKVAACSDFLPNPVPSIEQMKALLSNFMTAQASYKTETSDSNKQARDDAYNDLIAAHIAWIEYAEPLIGDDEQKADRFGYLQFANRTKAEVPKGVPPKPTFAFTEKPGEVLLRAKPYKQDKKTVYYHWQMSEDGGQTYQYLSTVGNSYRRLMKLELGKAYLIRVAYATVAGQGPFSEPIEVVLTKDMVAKPKKEVA